MCANFVDGAITNEVYQLKAIEVEGLIEQAIIAKMVVFETVRM